MVDHHVGMGVRGILIAGTCGEGPVIARREVHKLTSLTAEAASGRLLVSVQVTDNSSCRVLENIRQAMIDGADIAVLSEPWYEIPLADTACRERYYFDVLEHSDLPIGIYVRRKYLPPDAYRRMVAHPNVVLLKDSSLSDELMAAFVAYASERSDIVLLTGDEFHPGKYLRAGYDGILAGGCIVTGLLLQDILRAARAGEYDEVAALQAELDNIHHVIYGDERATGWLTGLKYTLKLMGVFSHECNYAAYPLSSDARKTIERLVGQNKYLVSYAEDPVSRK